jgi:hypothetical protein
LKSAPLFKPKKMNFNWAEKKKLMLAHEFQYLIELLKPDNVS